MKPPKDSKKAILELQWTVTLHPLAEDELKAIPADMKARFLHIGEMLVGIPDDRDRSFRRIVTEDSDLS